MLSFGLHARLCFLENSAMASRQPAALQILLVKGRTSQSGRCSKPTKSSRTVSHVPMSFQKAALMSAASDSSTTGVASTFCAPARTGLTLGTSASASTLPATVSASSCDASCFWTSPAMVANATLIWHTTMTTTPATFPEGTPQSTWLGRKSSPMLATTASLTAASTLSWVLGCEAAEPSTLCTSTLISTFCSWLSFNDPFSTSVSSAAFIADSSSVSSSASASSSSSVATGSGSAASSVFGSSLRQISPASMASCTNLQRLELPSFDLKRSSKSAWSLKKQLRAWRMRLAMLLPMPSTLVRRRKDATFTSTTL
mmetsp:Transcript_107210/g.320646  ORF Transcript_107210/g.320646 Transcript_107210/m.320646 type:complete len:314 (-) Transcript_107210:456-1397(-)